MKGKNILIFVVVLALFSQTAFCLDINIDKSMPSQIRAGEILQVNITIYNFGNSGLNLTAEETLQPENTFEYVNPANRTRYVIDYLRVPIFVWEFSLASGENKKIEYSIMPKFPGYFQFKPTSVYGENGGNYSQPGMVKVLCVPDGYCNTSIGENNEFCPEDCGTGISDYNCDGVMDGICDPDCISGDPDCSTSCGDGKCNGKENTWNCPQDCPSESNDSTNWYLILTLVIIIIAIAWFAYNKYIENKREEKILSRLKK